MAKHRLEDKLVPEPELPRQPQAQHAPAPASFQTASAQQTAPARTPIHAPVQTQAPAAQQTRAFQAPAPQQAPAAPSTPRATHRQERERTGFFSLRRKPADNLYERSFRFCTRCGNEVYVLADGCKHCGDARSLTPEPAL